MNDVKTRINIFTNAEMELVKWEEKFKEFEELELVKRNEEYNVKTGLSTFNLIYSLADRIKKIG